MKNKKEIKNYGKGVLSIGKYKGKTISQIIYLEQDYSYVIWLHENVKRITISNSDLEFCKSKLTNTPVI